MRDYLIAMVLMPLLVFGWLLVQGVARRFARDHPEFGPSREDGAGCGKSCGCHGGGCKRSG